MAAPFSEIEKLVKKAEAGEESLVTHERRLCVAHLMAEEPDRSNVDMARLFGVTEGAIRKDKDVIRKTMADEITKEDVGLVIADIRKTYERFVVNVEKSAKECTKGTNSYLNHQKALMDYQLKVVESLQSLGWYPKNLGQMTQTKFEFKSFVSKDGSVETRAVDMLDHLITQDQNPDDSEARAMLDAEFSELPRLPSPSEEDENGSDSSGTV